MLSQQIKGNQIHLYDRLLSISDADKEQSRLFLNNVKADKTYTINIKEYKEKRSLQANNLCWKLCSELANVMRTTKEEMYLQMLERYGVSQMITIWKEALPTLTRSVKYYITKQSYTHKDKEVVDVLVLTGSSSYTTKEMSDLLNGIVSEANEQGIPTIPDNEFNSLIEAWEGLYE